MHSRKVHLVEDFAGETVIVSADGVELARSEHTVTDPRRGYARILRVSLPDDARTVAVAIAGSDARTQIDVVPARLHHLRVFLRDGVLSAEAIDEDQYRDEPTGYG